MGANLFGEFFKKKRIDSKQTLRQFCMANNLDPGNISKIERGMLPPPTSSEKLKYYARCLNIMEGSDDWYELFDLAYACAGRIPEEILSDEVLISKLPLVFRTLRGQKLTSEQLDELIEKMRNV